MSLYISDFRFFFVFVFFCATGLFMDFLRYIETFFFCFVLFVHYRFGQMTSGSAVAAGGNLWPLVAVSHQMTVRDAVPLQIDRSDDLISRIQGS